MARHDPTADHVIRWSDGRATTVGSYQTAIDTIREAYPAAVIGHDGDLAGWGDRTLAWATEEDSRDDDGARAVASIYGAVRS